MYGKFFMIGFRHRRGFLTSAMRILHLMVHVGTRGLKKKQIKALQKQLKKFEDPAADLKKRIRDLVRSADTVPSGVFDLLLNMSTIMGPYHRYHGKNSGAYFDLFLSIHNRTLKNCAADIVEKLQVLKRAYENAFFFNLSARTRVAR